MEKSCGCIIFNDDKVLVIRQLNGDYGFPKGHINEGETEIECAIRETKEEVGINVMVESNYKFKTSYLIDNSVLKEVVYFIAYVLDNTDINIDENEIMEAYWVNIDKVYDIIEFPNLKELWLKAYDKYMEVHNG